MINKLKRFLTVVWRSATDFSYYKDIYQAPFSFSLKYLFILLFIINLIGGVIFAKSLAGELPKIPKLVEKIKSTVTNFYPADLVLTINNGKVRTNVDEPYYIDYGKAHIITIDTKASVEDIKKYQTIVLVTKNALVFPDKESGSYKVQFLSDIKGYYQIDKYSYNAILAKIFPLLNYLTPLSYILIVLAVFIFPFLAAFFGVIGQLFYLLFMGLVLWIIAQMIKSKIGYKKIIQLSLHGLTIPILLSSLTFYVNFHMPALSYSLIFLLLMIVVLVKLNEKAVELEKK